MNFGERLKQLRLKKGLTQQEFADLMGVGRPTVAGYETRGKQPDFEKLTWLSNFFNVSVDYLLGQEDINSPEKSQLTTKEKADIAKDLDEIKQQLLDSDELMFDGMPMDEESITKILSALEVGMEMVRKKNKEKYTPKKYKR